MNDFPGRRLKDVERLAIITSTHGEGDPPDNAVTLHEFLHGRKAPKLAQLKYSVLSLGDSSYEHFCKTGADFDNKLAELGGERLIEQIAALMEGRSDSPLAGLVSGSIDLDKIDYLSRDARNCGVPYGMLDVDRLLASLTLVDRADGGREIGVHEKGISALESLLFAKYQMYRNVYWHHAVRSATCMFKRAVRTAVRVGTIDAESLPGATDGSLTTALEAGDGIGLAHDLAARRLFKRALDLPAPSVPEIGEWIWSDPERLEAAEDRLAAELGLGVGEVLIDYPARSAMLGVDLPLLTRDGEVERLTDAGRAGHLGLPRIASELYSSARRFRVFTREHRRLDLVPAFLLA